MTVKYCIILESCCGWFIYITIHMAVIFSIIHLNHLPPEVITYDQWTLLKSENKNVLSGWIKGAFRGGKKEMQESIHQQLNNILSTAPIWDR